MSPATAVPEGDWICGISIEQPHVACITAGAKTIENRPLPWSWRGWVLLHAGKQIDRPALQIPVIGRTIRGRELVTSAMVGVAPLTDCHQDPDGFPACTEWAQAGAWHLLLADVRELTWPVLADGQLGLWRPSPDPVAQVFQQLARFRP